MELTDITFLTMFSWHWQPDWAGRSEKASFTYLVPWQSSALPVYVVSLGFLTAWQPQSSETSYGMWKGMCMCPREPSE